MDFVNYMYKHKQNISREVFKESLQKLLLLISPFTPHIAEEMWEKLGNKEFISTQKWPGFDESKIDEKTEAIISKIDMDLRAGKRNPDMKTEFEEIKKEEFMSKPKLEMLKDTKIN